MCMHSLMYDIRILSGWLLSWSLYNHGVLQGFQFYMIL